MPHLIQIAPITTPGSPRFQARRWWGGRARKLDLDSLPDHLKRDLGFLSGRTAPFRDPLRD
jgi:hypothetical protein